MTWIQRAFADLGILEGETDAEDIRPQRYRGIHVAKNWGELKEKVEAADRGDLVVSEQGNNRGILEADSTITVPDYVDVDLGAAEVVPTRDTVDLFDVGRSSYMNCGYVLPPDTWTGYVYRVSDDPNPINLWYGPTLDGRVNMAELDNGAVGVHLEEVNGGGIAGVTIDVDMRGGSNYVKLDSTSATGYVNGNLIRGVGHGQARTVEVGATTGAVDGNIFDDATLQATDATADVIVGAGRFWWGNVMLWDLGRATGGVDLSLASDWYLTSAHSSVTPVNLTGGGGGNRVYNAENGNLYYDDGTAFRTLEGPAAIQHQAANAESPDGTQVPDGTFIYFEDTGDGTGNGLYVKLPAGLGVTGPL